SSDVCSSDLDHNVTALRVTPSVLLVDDDASTLESLRHQLRVWDGEWNLTFALGATPALDALAGGVNDVVVADAATPGTNGESLLETVQERYPGLVRVAVSERPGEAAALRASAVAHRFLTKPIEEDDLRRVVERAAHLRSTLHNDDLRRAITASGSLPPAP